MELKQLEHFIAVAETGSINQAAQALYTSQPNVSKIISALEKELGCELLHRTNKGAVLTPMGEEVYEYAKDIIKNANILASISKRNKASKFSISCYPSHMISRVFCDFYNSYNTENIALEFLEGTIETITENVRKGLSEIGIVYFSKSRQSNFKYLLEHKNLELTILAEMEACIYAGPKSPLYHQESISFSQLSALKFVQMKKDFFSMEHDLDYISLGTFHMEKFDNIINTNSDNLLIDMLMHTDVCNLGIKFMNPLYEQYDIHTVAIEECDKCLLMGYIKQKGQEFSGEANLFLRKLGNAVNKSTGR